MNYIGLVLYASLESTIAGIICNFIAGIISDPGNYTGGFVRIFVGLTSMVVLFVIIGYFFVKAIKYLIEHSSPKKNMVHLSKALLRTLQEADFISYRAHVKETGNDLYIGIHLKEATIQEQNIFNQAVNEMLSTIENPRYVLVFKRYKNLIIIILLLVQQFLDKKRK